jgi:predicted enzyme related to lactoylglutathione lyase
LTLLAALALPASGAAPGEVLWVDLLTEDAAAAKAFYTDLFDWRVEESPTGSWVIYHQDHLIAGISEIENVMVDVEESMWLVGVAVGDLRRSVADARRFGGTVHIDVSRLEGYARYAVIADPQGAELLLLSPERALGGSEGPGSFVWSELWTIDRVAAGDFYEQVIGYGRSEIDRPRGVYTVLESGGEPRAGLVEFETDEIDPAWAPYIGVASLEATLARARELGGRVLLEPVPELAEGRVALLADPTGGAFFVFELGEERR